MRIVAHKEVLIVLFFFSVKVSNQYFEGSRIFFGTGRIFGRTQEGPAYPGFSIFIRLDRPTERASERATDVRLQRSNSGPYTFIKELGKLGTWELGNVGYWELGNLGTWALGNLGT